MKNNIAPNQVQSSTGQNLLSFIFLSAIGIFMFFVPITIGGKSTIPLDHIVTGLRTALPSIVPIYALIVIVMGGIWPFYRKTWNKDAVSTVFSMLKLLGIVIGFMAYLKIGPAWFFEKDMAPFLFDKLVIPVGLIVPVGSVFLAFLVGYGLLEFVGVLMKPIMRPIWKTPGRSAIDAVASFVGSYSIGLLITNRVFKEGKYTIREACIIATGFSTVSATFMIIVAKTLGLMPIWNTYFWTTLVVTFVVTAITARIKPLSSKADTYYTQVGEPESGQKVTFKRALEEGLKAAQNSPSVGMNIWINLRDGFIMAMGILPSIMSVGLLGLVLAKYTPVFDIIGYIFYPITFLFQIPEPMLAAKASALGIAEMFLPPVLVSGAPMVTKFIIGVQCVASVLFFSASIPCILSTEIPISIPEIIVIYIERTILTLILTAPLALLMF